MINMGKIRIGNVELEGNLILAPMAGVTDLPFRILCKEQGADLVYTEMISAKGIYYHNKNTEKLWEIAEKACSFAAFRLRAGADGGYGCTD